MSNHRDAAWLDWQAELTLARLLPRLEAGFTGTTAEEWTTFAVRLQAQFPRLFPLLLHLYGDRYDFFYHLEQILHTAVSMYLARPPDLKALDAQREADETWFQSQTMLGGVCYVDLFAGDLAGIRRQIPYFRELGLTYLHLMPLFAAPEGENDGGYAVSSYREVNPRLGTMSALQELACELRSSGISLVVDFVFNHTSNEHVWAQRALAGDPTYRDFYYIFPDRTMPDAYEKNLREIFPGVRRGSFTWRPDIHSWVWTTFHSYQWDLNYGNPAVFRAMLEEMLSLANAGVEILRLDAVAFIWKQLGSNCENLPEAHMLIQAFNALARIASPALLFKSEAIVHPDEVARYIGPGECRLSYNPLLMALLWESLATREVRLLQASMHGRFRIDPGCGWVNYVRCHDDIGWTFDDADAARVGIHSGYDHRRFLNAFYTGRFPGSFARGLPFQENPDTGDCRISGTCASLAGLEQALRDEALGEPAPGEHAPADQSLRVQGLGEPADEVELAIRRILLIHSVILSIGGIPLIYLGDELGTLNDYRYRVDPDKAEDSRWVHRPYSDANALARRSDPRSVEGRMFGSLSHLIALRKASPALAGNEVAFVESGNPHVFAYVRQHQGQRILVLANFSERAQQLPANTLRVHGLAYRFRDLVSGEHLTLSAGCQLAPYQFLWLAAETDP